jgi:hypothetical protein
MAKTANDLKGDAKVRFNSLGAAAQALIHFDRAVDGPGIIQLASARIMTGAINSAHASEQATAASGSNRNQPLSEAGSKPQI